MIRSVIAALAVLLAAPSAGAQPAEPHGGQAPAATEPGATTPAKPFASPHGPMPANGREIPFGGRVKVTAQAGGEGAEITWQAPTDDDRAVTLVAVLRHAGTIPSPLIPRYMPANLESLEMGTDVGAGFKLVALVKAGVTTATDAVSDYRLYSYAVVGLQRTSADQPWIAERDPGMAFPSSPVAVLSKMVVEREAEGIRLGWSSTANRGLFVIVRKYADEWPLVIRFDHEPRVGDKSEDGFDVIGVQPVPEVGFFDDTVADRGVATYAVAILDETFTKDGTSAWRQIVNLPTAKIHLGAPLSLPAQFGVRMPKNADGTQIEVFWTGADAMEKALLDPTAALYVLRNQGEGELGFDKAEGAFTGGWEVVSEKASDGSFVDQPPDGTPARYALAVVRTGDKGALLEALLSPTSEPISPTADYFNWDLATTLVVIFLMVGALFFYMPRVLRAPEKTYIRRIPGVDAIEESVGRSTEMGRPVLYVTGVEDLQNIQTIASLLCLGPVAEMTAEYDTELKVANFYPLTMVVAEEIMKQGYANAGRADAHRPENSIFISSEQFAFAAGVNGIILRDKPATNIYLGRFFAESLILAETGYITKSIQIAGTAEISQLPFFIAACDYTIIGEELYAVSAYLSREPKLLAQLKATDFVKLVIIVTVVVGALGATFGIFDLGPVISP